MDTKIRSEQLNDYNWYVDLYHNNIAAIKQDIKTRKCSHAEYVRGLVSKHHQLLHDTLYKPMRSRIVSKRDKKLIDKASWQELGFMNPHRLIPCQEATLRALEAYKIPLEGMSAFTVIHRPHETSNTAFIEEAATLNTSVNFNDIDIKRKFRDELVGYNYIGVIEFAIFEGVKFKDKKAPKNNGWVIAPHLQGLIWKDGGLTREEVRHFNTRFLCGRWGTKGFKHDLVYDVMGSAAYMHKLPLFSYSKTYRHSSKELSQDTAFVMFQRLKNIKFEQLFISGGEGQKVRTVVLNYLEDFYQEYR